MVLNSHTQSLADFREKATETLDRLNQTGEAEVLTVDGEVRAVLLSPAAYDTLSRESLLTQDASVIRESIQQLNEGKSEEANAFFDGVRSQFLAMKARQTKSVTE
jgi:PHD/YefM family antitoxin component YafN of YafNO toxin-antitoxin module